MDKYAIGFWGCYFGAAGLMLAGSVFAYIRSLRRIAVNAAASAVASTFFVVAFLGGLPISDGATLDRFLAHVASLVSVLLAYLLFSILGILRNPKAQRKALVLLAALALSVIATGWAFSPQQALLLSLAGAMLLGFVAMAFSLRNALRGDRLAWVAVSGVLFMLVAILGLSWMALARGHVPWQAHAVTALAGTAYLATMASVLWTRYSYLIELNRVMAHGPAYDPVTRMRSNSETNNMVSAAFKHHRDQPVPLGVIVVTIANLYVLEKLYGLAAVNHALFVCAGRLRRSVPTHIEMGRLGEDGFLLLMRNCDDSGDLIHLARRVQAALSRSVVLNTTLDAGAAPNQQTRWGAEVGVGVLRVSKTDSLAASAVGTGRGMSRAALGYPSRIAWFDESSGEIVDMPVLAD
ncbi:GGDEF domain-containing protein, diguanylate cyclase (c-di-GMP synthetase) or its enzymatically inactive variants [Polaromonas sp. YR568]|uniref:GGDEF domain-containing protein n=1 Tax=Polaromonas sp. YR568 TaxID=1855301 RepID=UPI0008E0FCC8|nr:GGDEF domain-containing protein [Polaromonas sp. YR568]SFV02431.1 GGDEF domain-containing protein, diguanylate cyclase (c-di-GMP synthetase) or its enzymatically inactive variants [Polaromonas sp. YR568]